MRVLVILGAFLAGWLLQDVLTEKPEKIIQKKSVTVRSAGNASCVFYRTERQRAKTVDTYLCGRLPVQITRETYEVAL